MHHAELTQRENAGRDLVATATGVDDRSIDILVNRSLAVRLCGAPKGA
jgi:hypothetical protein